MAWCIVVVAGLFGVVWAVAMKRSAGFTHLWPTVITFAAMAVSFGLLSWSMRSLPLGTAYTVWTGIGAVGEFAAGVALFGEPAGPLRISALLMVVGGLALIKATTSA